LVQKFQLQQPKSGSKKKFIGATQFKGLSQHHKPLSQVGFLAHILLPQLKFWGKNQKYC